MSCFTVRGTPLTHLYQSQSQAVKEINTVNRVDAPWQFRIPRLSRIKRPEISEYTAGVETSDEGDRAVEIAACLHVFFCLYAESLFELRRFVCGQSEQVLGAVSILAVRSLLVLPSTTILAAFQCFSKGFLSFSWKAQCHRWTQKASISG